MSDKYEDIQVIGDELHFDGMLVAIMTDNAPPTHLGRFVDLLNHGEEKAEAEDEKPAPSDDTVLDQLWSDATDAAKGGLLRMGDLANIVTRLKEAK